MYLPSMPRGKTSIALDTLAKHSARPTIAQLQPTNSKLRMQSGTQIARACSLSFPHSLFSPRRTSGTLAV